VGEEYQKQQQKCLLKDEKEFENKERKRKRKRERE
jgi:hypothetical protein